MLGIAAAFGGVVVIFLPSILSSALVVGDLYALVASLSWAIAIILFKRWRTHYRRQDHHSDPVSYRRSHHPPCRPRRPPFRQSDAARSGRSSATTWCSSSGLAYVVFWKVLARMPAAQFASYFFLVPVFAVTMGTILQFSAPPLTEVAGTALVALGIIAVNR